MSFYTDNPLEVWQSVLGPSMHYHVGGDQAVRDLYPYIDNNSSILDIGCGWGGPARLLTDEKHCNLHGVTNSKQQYDNYPYTVSLSNANHYTPDTHYDTTIFIESLCHLTPQILTAIRPYTKRIIIKDYLSPHNWYNKQWEMYMRTEKEYKSILSPYNITHLEITPSQDIYNSSLYWYNNINKLSPNQITHQIESLLHLTGQVVDQGPSGETIKLITIVAE